jgi:hypothetical protein
MPHLALEIPEVYDSVTRPVTLGLVRDLVDRLSLPKDTLTHYQGAAETLAQTGSTLGAQNTKAAFPYTGKVQVSVEETYLDTAILTTAITRYDNNYIFFDPALKVAMWPIYTKTEAVVNFKYRATSRTKALQWRDSLRRRMTQQQQSLLHEIIYHYSIPPVFHEILKEIWRKRESIAGYGEDFLTWIRNCYDFKMTVLSTLSGEQGLVTIPEKQIQVQGWFSFLTEPDAIEKSQEGETWEVTFDYTIQYEKVTGMVLQYPIVVHSQLLDTKYLCTETPYNPYNEPHKPSKSGRLNELFSKTNYNTEPVFVGVRLPTYDDWKPKSDNYLTFPIFTSLIGVDPADPHQIVNFLDLGETALTQTVANFIFRERHTVLYYTKCVFHITFFKGERQLDPSNLILDADLNLRTTVPMDLREVYHVKLAILTELSLLSEEARTALRNDPMVCIQVFDLLDCLQSNRLPFIESLSIHLLAEIQDHNFGWSPKTAPRPGFTLPSGDWTHIRGKDGNLTRPYGKTGDENIQSFITVKPYSWFGNYRNGEYPTVPDVFPDLTWCEIAVSFSDTLKVFPHQSITTLLTTTDTVVVAAGPYSEGCQPILAIYQCHYVYGVVNHFLQASIVDVRILTELDYAALYLSHDWSLLKDPSVLGAVYLPSGIYKPTFHNADPYRIQSPERPGITGDMLSNKLVILGGRLITKPSFDFALSFLRSQLNLSGIGHGMGMKTVMQVGIIAHK